jgi:hypothetical protein
MTAAEEFRTLQISRLDAATLYEGLTLLSLFESKPNRKQPLPYDAASLARLRVRLMERWPELKPTYAPNRAERRSR